MISAPPSEFAEYFPNRKRWTRSEYEFLERVGMLPGRYELIDGEVVEKTGQNRPHAITVALLIKWLIAVFGGEFVQCQIPIEVADRDRPTCQPEPDASVLREPVTAYPTAAPGPGDIRFVAEVSDTTLQGDLQIKAPLYARAEIPEYWVLDVPSRRLFVHRRPENGLYTDVFPVTPNDSIATEAATDQSIRIADLLPPESSSDAA